jgi:biotin carboxyl carrier protein
LQYDVEIGGRTRHVVVHRQGDGFHVSIDGRPFAVSAARIDAQVLSLIIETGGTAGMASFEVAVAPDAASGQLIVRVGATPVRVGLNGRRRFGQRGEHADAGSGPQQVAAPMPGKIVRVLVKKGEGVVARQPLVVIEAMKMENELRAGREGTIAEVHAQEGQSVEAGALLVVIQ